MLADQARRPAEREDFVANYRLVLDEWPEQNTLYKCVDGSSVRAGLDELQQKYIYVNDECVGRRRMQDREQLIGKRLPLTGHAATHRIHCDVEDTWKVVYRGC